VNGDTNGRKLTINAQASITASNTGNAQHMAIVDFANSKLLYVSTCTPQVVTAPNPVNFPAWDIEFADPT
jgi:hypothetical protein